MLGESIELYVLIEQKEHCATQKNQGLEALDSSLGLIFPSQGLTLARQCIILIWHSVAGDHETPPHGGFG